MPSDRPAPPDQLVGALQDRVHKELGPARPARSVKVRTAPPEVEPTEAEWKLAQSVYLGACICGNTSGDGLVCGKHVAVAHALAAHRASVSAEAQANSADTSAKLEWAERQLKRWLTVHDRTPGCTCGKCSATRAFLARTEGA